MISEKAKKTYLYKSTRKYFQILQNIFIDKSKNHFKEN